MQPAFRVSFDSHQIPPLVSNSNEFKVTASFDFVEIIFASFVSPLIDASLKKGSNYVFIGSNNLEPMQNNFNAFLKQLYPKLNILPADRNVLNLIQAIWEKSRVFINMKLAFFEPAKVDNEKKEYDEALKFEKEFQQSGYKGKMFTLSQAKMILEALNEVAKKGHQVKNQTS
ncbi:MAG: hypothetical protein ACK4HV_09370 [Parachlamydiaceae bacterium]